MGELVRPDYAEAHGRPLGAVRAAAADSMIKPGRRF